MAFFNDLSKKLTDTAKTVSKKSEELVEQTKLNMAIGNEEDKIKKLCEELGSEIYKEYKNGKSFGAQFDERCNFIKQSELNIQDLRNKIQGIKGTKMCKSCGQSVDQDLSFCPKCGAKVDGTTTVNTTSYEAPTPSPSPSPNPTPTDSTDYSIKPE